MSQTPIPVPAQGLPKIDGDRACYPGTNVLINKFDIKDKQIAHNLEYKFASVRALELEESPIKGNFDLAHLQSIHQYVFQDMYEWGGQIRTIDFAKRNKETGMVNKFVPEAVLDLKAEQMSNFLAERDNLKGLPKAEFVQAFAEVHSMVNALHPFREGNGRATKIFMAQLAKEAGYTLDLRDISKADWDYASHKAQPQHHPSEPIKIEPDKGPIEAVFARALQPTREHAFKNETREVALAMYPDLNSTFSRLDKIEQVSPSKDAAGRLVDAEKVRIADRLTAETEVARKAEIANRLETEKLKLTGVRAYAPDGYEIARNVIEDSLKGKGLSPAAIEKTMAIATARLDKMREEGRPAPGFAEKGQQREVVRNSRSTPARAGPEQQSPTMER